MIEKLVKRNLVGFVPYKMNFVPANIRLDANEGPFDLSENVKKKIVEKINSDTELNRYPDALSTRLRDDISIKYGCDPSNIIVGSGSDQLLSVIINTFVDFEDTVIAPWPSFDMYKVSSIIGFAKVIEHELLPSNDYKYDIPKLLEEIIEYKPKIVFLCSPNNPTGNSLTNDEIKRIICAAKDSLVVIDEAYVEFSNTSFTPEILNYENAIVLRTFSKAYGIAGLRCGYSISNEMIANELLKVLPPYNISQFSQDVARYVLLDDKENMRRIDLLKNERDRVVGEIKKIDDIKVYPTDSNFYLIKSLNGTNVYDELLKRGIRIRKYTDKRLLEDCYRINVGSIYENDELIKSIYDVFK